MIPEFQIKQFDKSQPIQETIAFVASVNLVGAGAQFVYRLPDGADLFAEAVIVSTSPSAAAATSVVLKNVWDDESVESPGVFQYEWKIILADGSVIARHLDGATEQFPNRTHRAFEVVECISPAPGDDSEEATLMKTRPITVDTLAELAALPASENYGVAFVESDSNGNLASYVWDINSVNTYPTSDAVVGHWVRKGL